MLKNKLLIFFIILTLNLFTQNNRIDSLLNVIEKSAIDTEKINLLNEVANHYKLNEKNYQSAIKYATIAKNESEKIDYKAGSAIAYKIIATSLDWDAYLNTGNYHEVIPNFLKSLKLYTELQNKSEIADINYQIGYSLDYQSNYNGAIKYYLQALRLSEELRDTLNIARIYFVIGQSNNFQNKTNKAFEALFKSYTLAKKINNKAQEAECLALIGDTHAKANQLDSAIQYLTLAIDIKQEIPELKNELGEIYTSLSEVYLKNKEFKLALDYANKSFAFNDVITDTYAQAKANSLIGKCYVAFNRNNEAILFFEKAIKYAQLAGSKNFKSEQYLHLSNLYEKLNNKDKAFVYYKNYIVLRDSVFNEDKAKAEEREELLYLFGKQETEQKLIQAQKDTAIETQIKQQNHVRNVLILICGAIAIVAGIILYNYYQKKKSNEIIQKQKDEIIIQNTEITKQKKAIEEKNKNINESIINAQNLQNVIFPTTNVLNKIIPNHFVIHLPKDIVSGDFYWAYENEQYKYIALVDCTGHGVSGALMSMLAYNLLNDSVIYRGGHMPSKILDVLNQQVLSSLTRNTHIDDSIEGGMDISICCIDKKNNKLYASSAHQPIYIVNSERIEVIPGDIHSIGWRFEQVNNNYSQVEIPLNQTTFIYLSSDGFKDQFGGPQRKKYSATRFEKLIAKVSLAPIEQQQKQILTEFEQWKQTNEQLDDICIIGFKAL